MTEGKGGCCIARRGGGHVAEYNSSSTKMDMIMLKFRPIAPKPVDGTTASTAVDGGSSSVSHHAKAGGSGRGRRKNKNNNTNNNNNSSRSNSNSNSGSTKRCNNNNNNSYNNNGGRKRKSSSPDQDQNEKSHHHDEDEMMISDDQKTDLTLLPLFPEAPDLSPNNSYYYNNNNQMEEDINIQLPMFSLKVEGNYKECHHHQHSWW